MNQDELNRALTDHRQKVSDAYRDIKEAYQAIPKLDLSYQEIPMLVLSNEDLNNMVAVKATMKGLDGRGSNFERARLDDANMEFGLFNGANFGEAGLERTRLYHADLNLTDFSAARVKQADARDVSAHESSWERADMRGMWLHDADLTYSRLVNAFASDAVLQRATLRWSEMRGIDLARSNCQEADLSHCRMENSDLSGADLRGADLRGVDLSHANLQGADLRGAKLDGADLRHVNLTGTDLRGVDLRGANLEGARFDVDLVDPEVLEDVMEDHSRVPRTGEFTGYKVVWDRDNDVNYMAELTIPADAERTSSLACQDSRASYVQVKSLRGIDGEGDPGPIVDENGQVFETGKTVVADHYDADPTHADGGITFFEDEDLADFVTSERYGNLSRRMSPEFD